MKIILFSICILFIACGSNLIGEEEDRFRPSNLIYEPDSLFLDRSVDSVITSSTPIINEGSGSVSYEIAFPVVDGLSIDQSTGVVTVNNTLDSNMYYIDIIAKNYVGSSTFTSALIIHVK